MFIDRAKRVTARWFLRGGSSRQDFYYKFFSEAFNREQRAVGRGIGAYSSDPSFRQNLYLLRRNTHMIEKGLTMRPRRNEFAVDYIGKTISTLASLMGLEAFDGSEEQRWVQSVLTEYFSATLESRNADIERSRIRFEKIVASQRVPVELGLGPKNPAVQVPSVGIDALAQLAARRTSVRWFTDQPIERGKVDKAIQIASESPTACNRQPYRFEVFDSPESIAKVAAIPMGTRGYGQQIPGMIVVVGDLSAFFDERDRHLIYVDSCLASMALIFGLESQGIASCCINWPDIPEKEAAMKKLLGLQDYERVVMLIAYGFADPAGLAPASAKKSLDKVRSFRSV